MQAILAEYEDENGGSTRLTGTLATIEEARVGRFGLSLPRAFAMERFGSAGFRDATIDCKHGLQFPAEIAPRDDRQSAFFDSLYRESTKAGPQDILAIAATGSGKSVAGINLGQRLGQRTLIIVDQNKIASGWIHKNFDKFYGEDWVTKHVGRVQQDTMDIDGKAFVIALAQTLARRKYEPWFYRQFGLVLFDEVQVFGAPHFGKLLGMFPARVRVGFTAEEKSGQFGKMVRAHLGSPRVHSTQEVLQPVCYMLRNRIEKPFYCENDGSLLTNLSLQKDRNDNLAKLIKRRGFDRGRNVLVLSNRTAHLVDLRNRCAGLGVPGSAMGLHMAQYESGRYDVCYRYEDSETVRKFLTVENLDTAKSVMRGVKRNPDQYRDELPKTVYNRLQAGENVDILYRKEIYKPSQTELDDITNSCQIVFATYEIFSKGVDVPRLDMGVEALPSGNVKQPLGRVLRLHEGKPQPEWYAIDDRVAPSLTSTDEGNNAMRWTNLLNLFFEGKTNSRIKALKRAGARIAYQ